MAKGTIQRLLEGRGFGFIKPDGGGMDVYFRLSWLKGVTPREGLRVEFDIEQGERGPRARNLRALEGATDDQSDGYRFLNPYNFVRLLGKPRPENHVLGNCPPPPHDRFVGLTGRITCQISAVTPLFISDSHAIWEDANGHKTYRFFQVDSQPAIPASSLRGMVRSVFEAVTNSCFSIIHDEQLKYRIGARMAPSLHPAVVTKLPNPKRQEDGEVILLKSAWIHRSVIEDAMKGVLDKFVKEAPWPKEPPFDSYFDRVLTDQAVPVLAKIRENVKQRDSKFGGKRYRFSFNEVLEIVDVGRPEQGLQKPQRDLFWGYLKITGPNVLAEKPKGTFILRKHDERFFYWDGKNKQIVKVPWQDVINRRNAAERYNSVRAYQSNPANQQLPYVTYLQNEKLTEGDLIWVWILQGKVRRVEHIGSVSIPKLEYKHGILDLLSQHQRCLDYDTLCPACRVFGWVREGAGDIEKDEPTAYAGRVRFSHGKLIRSAGELPETTLAILSTPKPTTTSFYLLNSEDQPDAHVTYDTHGAQLRGRKFYRHHGQANSQEYRRNEKSDQNRTIRGALRPDSTFTFTLDFENLHPLELGALLYALELEEGMYHRLGYAKPLGFGSVKITVDEVKVVDWEQRLKSLDANAGWKTLSLEERRQYRKQFHEQMREFYGDDFDSIVLADLRALLGEPPELPIHYPRPTRQFDPNHPQYEWFVGNKRRSEPIVLSLAKDDSTGLPLLDKKGKEVS